MGKKKDLKAFEKLFLLECKTITEIAKSFSQDARTVRKFIQYCNKVYEHDRTKKIIVICSR